MYMVTKDKGVHSNVTLTNTETKSSLIIGRASTEIVKIIVSEDYKPDDEVDFLRKEWTLNVEKETADKLSRLALTMKKPVRKPKETISEQPKTEEKPKTANKNIDAMDVLLGLASYN